MCVSNRSTPRSGSPDVATHMEDATHTPHPLPHISWWHAAIFCVALALLLTAALHIVGATLPAGDEPWYLLQGYGMWHFHSPDLAAAVRTPSIYSRFLANLPDDHTRDFLGNGERVLAYLPGYAVLIGPLYAMGGRPLIAGAQALLAALVGVLLYDEALRLHASRGAAIVAALAFATSLPVLAYAGEMFPTTVALAAVFAGYLLIARILPATSGRHIILAGLCLGVIAFALPWLHTKYALIGIVLPALGLSALRRRPRWRSDRATWCAAVLIVAVPTLSFALIVLYSRHFFGTWYPQYRTGTGPSFGSPNPGNAVTLFERMFLDAQVGLLPWAPVYVFAPLGWVLLARRWRREALLIAACLFGLLGMFLSVIVAGGIGVAYAFPARFCVESVPFLALCVGGVFAAGEPALRQTIAWLARLSHGVERLPARATRGRILQVGLASACLVLLAFGGWLSFVPQLDPPLLYPSEAGPRLTYEFPNLLPSRWFALFPESESIPTYTGAPRFDPSRSHGVMIHDGQGKAGYLAAGDSSLNDAVIAETVDLRLPPGRYEATFIITCDPLQDASALFTVVALRNPGTRNTPVSSRTLAGTLCQGATVRVPVSLRFVSDGYRLLALAIEGQRAMTLTIWSVTFSPAPEA